MSEHHTSADQTPPPPAAPAGSPALRPIEDAFPLTHMQQALLVRCVSYPDQPVYMGQWWVVLDGSLDDEAFAAAWQGVVDRHTALRCGFHWDLKDHPFQVVHRQAPLAVRREDWSGAADWKARLDSFLVEDRARPFDLRKPPLMRVALIRLAPMRHLVVWSRHHLTVDGWSLGIILGEVFTLYTARRAGRPSPLKPAPAFRAYVEWERSQDRGAALRHWRAVLADHAPDQDDRAEPTRVTPADGTAPDIRSVVGHLPGATVESLTALARSARVTLNTVVQAAWALVESRISGSDTVLFGAVETVRPPHLAQDGSAALVGVQVQVLPVLARIGDAPLRDWLESLQAGMVATRAVGAIGMDDLRDLLDLPRDCLPFASLVGVQNYPLDEAGALAGSGLTLVESGDVTLPDMPLNLMVEQQDGLSLRLMFDGRRYSLAEAGLRLDMMAATLAALPGGADRPAAAIDALPASVVDRLLGEEGAGAPLEWPERTVVSLILEQAAGRPDAPAVVHGGQRVTYAGLVTAADAIAARLAAHGIGRGARVGLHLERTPLAIAAILGILLRGASYVPLDPDAPDERKAFMIAEAAMAGVLTAGPAPVAGAATIVIGDIGFGDIGFGEAGFGLPAAVEARALPTAADEAYVIFTSGSTGRPKGVSVGHDNLAYHVAAKRAAFPDQPIRSLLLSFPLVFDGSVTGIFNTLADGGALVLPRPVEATDPDRLAALIRAEGVSNTIMIPSQWNLLLSAEHPAALAGVETAVVAGEACPSDLVERHRTRLPGTLLCNEYGPTETTVWATLERCAGAMAGPVSIGRPIPGTRVYVVDRRNRLCPPGAVGELLVAGPGVARGYVGRPDLTAERFTANPFHGDPGFATVYRTGDRVAMGFDGRLWFHGRADDQVKINGHRIELAEIGACLQNHPAVEEAVAVVHRAGAQDLIVAHAAGPNLPDADAILRHAQRFLPAYMMPHSVVLHERLPRNATGKVDRRRLPEPRLQELSAAPEGPVEQAVARVWQAVLGRDAIGRFDNFFAIGGGSLAAMQAVSRLRRERNHAVELIDLFECPRLDDFARRLAGRVADQGTPAIRKRQRVAVDLTAPQAHAGTGR